MQEFRPASVIEADTELARRLNECDVDAIRALVDRYGVAIAAAVTPAVGREGAQTVAVDVFVDAQRAEFVPGDDFARRLVELAAERAGSVDEQKWALAMATTAVDPDVRLALREHHLGGAMELEGDLARHELRLQRRLAHLGGSADLITLLADPDVWGEPDRHLAERVLAALDAAPTAGALGGDDDVPGEVDEGAEKASPMSRALRPVLLGLGGAVLVLFVAIIALSAASGSPTAPNYTVELTPTGLLADVEGGEITVTERDAGVQIELAAVTLPRRAGGAFYEGRLVLVDGTEVSTGTFTEGVEVTLWGGIALEDAVAFRIVAGVLGDAEPSEEVVLKADLPRP